MSATGHCPTRHSHRPTPHRPHCPSHCAPQSVGYGFSDSVVFPYFRLSLSWADYSVPRVLVLVCVLIPGRTQFKVDYNISPLMLQQMG